MVKDILTFSTLSSRCDFTYSELKLTPILSEFRINEPFRSGEEVQNRLTDFQNRGRVGSLGFSVRTILVMFDLQVTQILPTRFRVNSLFCSGEKIIIDFQDGGHLGSLIQTILAIFDLQVTPILPIKFQVS